MNRGVQRVIIAFVSSVSLAIVSTPSTETQAAGPAKDTTLPRTSVTTPQTLTELEIRLERVTKQLVADRFAESGKEVIEKAQHAKESAESLLSVIRWVSTGWLTVVTIVVGAMIFLIWREVGIVKIARDELLKSAEKAKTAEGEVRASADRLRAMDEAIRQATSDVKASLTSVRRIARRGVVGELSALPPVGELAKLEEADILIVLADRIKALPQAELAEPLLTLAYYWRFIHNYPRALARFGRAIQIDPGSVEAHRGLCITYYSLSAEGGIAPAYKKQLLEMAENECHEVVKLKGKDSHSLFDLGWICDEREDYERAIGYYREAEAIDKGGAITNIKYNIACSYSKWGQYEEALQELKAVIGKDENWDHAVVDRDFDALRKDSTFGPRFERLIEEARASK